MNPPVTNAQRDKKRNHTLQVQRVGLLRQLKPEKERSEKIVPKCEETREVKAEKEGET